MLFGSAAALINHFLRDADWALERLAPFAGSSVRFEVPPLSAALTIQADGRLLQAPPNTEPAAVVRATGPTLVRLLWMQDVSARQEVQIDGDAALVSVLTGVMSGVRWDVEEDLSRIVGDITAHRLTQMGSAFFGWHVKAAANLAQSMAEYLTEERPLIASRDAVRGFVQAVDDLRDDAERLEKRIERLSRPSSPSSGT
jgi:ubiquinone biosynthesis accessory factor UbiJ